MSTIAAGGVSGMTADVKTLHVKPEALSLVDTGSTTSGTVVHMGHFYKK